TLAVNSITADGKVAVTVSKAGYAFEPKSQSVLVFCPPTERPSAAVTFQFLTANGSATETTTALTLAFRETIEGLTADDITLEDPDGAGIRKGALWASAADSYSKGVYALAVSGFAKDAAVTVRVQKAGYAFAPPALTAQVRYVPAPTVAVRFQSLTADGGETAGTTKLTLAFDKAIEGLSMEDITLTDPEGTGIVLPAQQFIAENGAYTLAVSSVGTTGHVVVKAAKAGYAFTPDTQSAR
uniref:hypothetical protein n=1 Tax=Treponema endosymbiont of Eucomonympha sp. TaxID=1580831 RepID=UPI000AC2E9B9